MKHTHILMTLVLLSSQFLFPISSFATQNTNVATEAIAPSTTTDEKLKTNLQNVAEEEVTESSITDSQNVAEERNTESSITDSQSVTEEEVTEVSTTNPQKVSEAEKEVTDISANDSNIVDLGDVDISVGSDTVNSEDSPLTGNGFIYNVIVKNNNSDGNVIPKGSQIKINLTSNSMDPAKLISTDKSYLANSSVTPNLYELISYSNGVIIIENTQDLYQGVSSFNLTLVRASSAQTDSGAILPISVSGEFLLNDDSSTSNKEFPLDPSIIYIATVKSGGGGGQVSVPGYVDYAGHSLPDVNYLGSKLGGYGQFDGSKTYNGSLYMSFLSAWVKGYVSNNRVVLWSQSNHAIPKENYKIYTNSNGKITDLTDTESFVWEYSENGVKVDLSNWSKTEAGKLSNGAAVYLVSYIPVSSEDEIVIYNGNLGWYGIDQWPNAPTLSGVFKNPSSSTSVPYFRTTGNATIYNTDTYSPMTGINAYLGTEQINEQIEIQDLDGYPESGEKPEVGTYNIQYSIQYLDENGEISTKTTSRIITVIENKQAIVGSDYTMYIGDREATLADFNTSATDKDGNSIEVTADLSKIDFSKVGTYDVELTATDGQTKLVQLIIKENKQAITGSDYTMYTGDKNATLADFNASATDKAGDPIDVTADLSKVDFSKVGTYDVELTATDGQTKLVQLIIKENRQAITGSDYTMYVGDPEATLADFNASAVDKDGNMIELTLDLSKVDFSKAGTYEVVLAAADGQKKSVQLIILDKEVGPSIEATDKTMYVGDTLTKEDILAWATFNHAEGLTQGFEVIGTPIPISSSDKLTTGGEYKIKYYVQGKTKATEDTLAEKEITLTVVKKTTGKTNHTDPSKTIDSGSTGTTVKPTSNVSSSKSFPNTGEQKTNLFYVFGNLLVVASCVLYVWMRKEKQK
ncbi:hypothetical protein [Enterococcus sp. AZ126]|uniref:hypothetical protein n=1 Tax=Enterococcus sp. AZ126 TaxID=2774635 RepID=UPI003F2130D1